VRIPSVTGEEGADRGGSADGPPGWVTRVDADPSQLAATDFPGGEVLRTTRPWWRARSVGRRAAPGDHRRPIDTVSPGQRGDWSTDPFGAELRDGARTGAPAGHEGRRGGGLAALRALVDTETELQGGWCW
jgi:hypothetical protein